MIFNQLESFSIQMSNIFNTNVETVTQLSIHSFKPLFIGPSIHSFKPLFIHPFIHTVIHSFKQLFIRPFKLFKLAQIQTINPSSESYMSKRHLDRATPGHQSSVYHHVARHVERVLEVPLYLVEDVLARSAQQDGASLRVLALCQEREISATTAQD